MNLKSQRGSSLVIAMIAIGVLMVLVVAAIQFTGTNREGALAKLRSDELASCQESAKRIVMAQIAEASRNNPGQVVPLEGKVYSAFKLLDSPDESERTELSQGHYSNATFDAGVEILKISGTAIASSSRSARDLSNAAPTQTGFGGLPYRVVMKCRDRGGREAEVEFVFRYGF